MEGTSVVRAPSVVAKGGVLDWSLPNISSSIQLLKGDTGRFSLMES